MHPCFLAMGVVLPFTYYLHHTLWKLKMVSGSSVETGYLSVSFITGEATGNVNATCCNPGVGNARSPTALIHFETKCVQNARFYIKLYIIVKSAAGEKPL